MYLKLSLCPSVQWEFEGIGSLVLMVFCRFSLSLLHVLKCIVCTLLLALFIADYCRGEVGGCEFTSSQTKTKLSS